MWSLTCSFCLCLMLFVNGIAARYKIEKNGKVIYPQVIKTKSGMEIGICSSDKCATASEKIFNYIKEENEPCENFFQLACGKFVDEKFKNTSITFYSNTNGVQEDNLKELKSYLGDGNSVNGSLGVNLAKDFYKSCMDNETREAQGERKKSSDNTKKN